MVNLPAGLVISNNLLEETVFNCPFQIVSGVSEEALAGIAMNSLFCQCMLHREPPLHLHASCFIGSLKICPIDKLCSAAGIYHKQK